MKSKHSKERKNTEKENGKNILISLKTKEKKEDIQNERNNRKSKRGNKNKIKVIGIPIIKEIKIACFNFLLI